MSWSPKSKLWYFRGLSSRWFSTQSTSRLPSWLDDVDGAAVMEWLVSLQQTAFSSTTSALVPRLWRQTTLASDGGGGTRRGGGTWRAGLRPSLEAWKQKRKMSKTLTFAQILSSPVLLPPSFLARGSSLWSLLASMVVPQQLSQKAFEKLATNQDLSNAIEKVSKDDDEDDYVDFFGS